MMRSLPKRQGGASIVTAIFIITALAALGAAMSRLVITTSVESAQEYISAQALYAAESGIDWAVYDVTKLGGTGNTANAALGSGSAWYSTTVRSWSIDSGAATYYEITSTGKAGGTAASPVAQRQLRAYFME